MRALALLFLVACAPKPVLRDDSVAPRAGIPPPPDVAAPPADAQMRASGVAIKVLRAGKGEERPWSRDRVTVHYTGWTTDGKMFDSSVERGKPITFGLTEVIPGWSEAVQQMVEGDLVRVWIPEALAYKGQAPKGMLVFEIELIKIVH